MLDQGHKVFPVLVSRLSSGIGHTLFKPCYLWRLSLTLIWAWAPVFQPPLVSNRNRSVASQQSHHICRRLWGLGIASRRFRCRA